MNLIKNFNNKRGQITVFCDEDANCIFVKPEGFIGKQLLQQFLKDLELMNDTQTNRSMHHIIDTSKVIFANPLNPLYLRAIKKLKNIGWYIVIVPNPILRIFVYLTSWINSPDVILKSMESCQIFLEENGNKQ